MKIDVVKIITVIAPLIQMLIESKVPKKRVTPYVDAADAADKVMNSLQDLAIKIKVGLTDPDQGHNLENFKNGIDIIEKTIRGYEDRLTVIKQISGLYDIK